MSELTASRLRELLEYDPTTGIFRWKVKRRKVNAGDIAGCVVGKRYRTISVDSRTYLAHRLAWLYHYGQWPNELVDHIDLDGFNNRIANLREATPRQNMHNRRGDRNSASGMKGVTFRPNNKINPWEANIMFAGIPKYLGQFPTRQAAASAYRAAAETYHGAFAGGA